MTTIPGLSQVADRYFDGQPHVAFRINLEGTEANLDQHQMAFGLRAGPAREISNLIHEMAHFVVAPEAKCIANDYAMKAGVPVIGFGRVEYVPTSVKPVDNEARVFAYQLNILRHLGLDGSEETLESCAELLSWVSGYHLVPGESEQERRSWCVRRIEEWMETCTAERFEEIWFDRIRRIPDLMDAKLAFLRIYDKGQVVDTRTYVPDDHDEDAPFGKVARWEEGQDIAFEAYLEYADGEVMEWQHLCKTEQAAVAALERLFGCPVKQVTEAPALRI